MRVLQPAAAKPVAMILAHQRMSTNSVCFCQVQIVILSVRQYYETDSFFLKNKILSTTNNRYMSLLAKPPDAIYRNISFIIVKHISFKLNRN